ncbi:hypothetical protein GQ607_000057 [Colletotrichum asianum]|uniref:Uncharacterized protein n=1 Tax=Colletotrichum asianum TaxID=702518 RepID=A0A8H3WNW4_9PEZI|nr:hypothetical protein GQ607_000057 [Colletotrichum asianum]
MYLITSITDDKSDDEDDEDDDIRSNDDEDNEGEVDYSHRKNSQHNTGKIGGLSTVILETLDILCLLRRARAHFLHPTSSNKFHVTVEAV